MQVQIFAGKPYPIGVSYRDDGINFSFPCMEKECGLILYETNGFKEIARLPFPKEGAMGSLRTMFVKGIDREKTAYRYFIKNEEIVDERAHRYYEKRECGESAGAKLYGGFLPMGFEKEEKAPLLSYEETVVYCLHVRGFTKHASSKVGSKERGTFQGICKKISYLKDLGITTLELQPAYEFDENPSNYWGYTKGRYYSPKNNYAAGEDACTEFCKMVKQLHENQMEVIMQFYFPEHFSHQCIMDILHFWVMYYHVDGFYLKGKGIPVEMLLSDPGLSGVKLWFEQELSKEHAAQEFYNCLSAEHRGTYRDDMRRFLKADAGSLVPALVQMREKKATKGRINYFSNYDGFTLMDMVSYDKKHNEENGENNKDGSDDNYSWNCGVEGVSRKKAVKSLRLKQIKNALCMLFLSQGTPLIFMGDEFGNTQYGNNNPYCQDNEVTWLDWGMLKKNAEIYEFARQMIAFRRKYRILRLQNGPEMKDYKAYGYPDLSYHGTEAWKPDMEQDICHIGMMYCCAYGEETLKDHLLYVAVNMHWREQEFGLPKSPAYAEWKLLFTTFEDYDISIKEEKNLCVPGRSIVVLGTVKEN